MQPRSSPTGDKVVNAADIMTRAVVSVDPDLPLAEVAKLMLGRGISAVCVVERDGRLVGMVSEGDLVHRAEIKTETHRSWWLRVVAGDDELAADYVKCRGSKARDVMTRTPVTVTEATPVSDIVALLDQHRIKRVPVVRDGRVVGIVSRANLLRAFAAEASREPPDLSADDRAIRARLLQELGKQTWWHGREEEIVVADGTVHLWGTVRSTEEKHALSVAAESTPGVKAVRNHVTVSAPVTLYAS
jgi:CBS domain-containing protein